MRHLSFLSLALLVTLGVSAQSKLSSTITDMLGSVQQQIAEARQVEFGSSLPMTTEQECPVDTAEIQKRMVVSFNSDGTVKTVDVLAELAEGATCPTEALEARGISVTGSALGMMFLTVPASQLGYLETLEEFIHLFPNEVYETNNDESRVLLNVSKVNGIDNTSYSFTSPYTGKGVVVGIVDAGIDYNHIAFKDSEGNTRVKKVVHYKADNSTATIATTAEDIAALTYDASSDSDKSHGTHVAASAAGSQLNATVDYSPYTRNLMGMAPEADIVLCGTRTLSSAHVATSVEEIVKTAKELGEPCVINMSFGTAGGEYWHDGTSSTNTTVNKVAGEGVIFCLSTANEARNTWTVDKTIPAGEYMKVILRKTLPYNHTDKSCLTAQNIYFRMPGSTSIADFIYDFEVIDTITGVVTPLSTTPLIKVSNGSKMTDITFTARNDASHNDWTYFIMPVPAAYFETNSKFLAVKIKNNTDADKRVYVAAGKAHMEEDVFASTDFPNYEYDKGTADMSINESCSSGNLITVGAYTRSNSFTTYGGYTLGFNTSDVGNPNSTAAFSSYGKDDFGKAHPDVIAPGAAIMSAYNHYDTSKATASDKTTWDLNSKHQSYIGAYYTDSNNKTHLWYINNGTSMAAPITTGIVALWLQADPTLTPEKVREVIVQTSRTAIDGKDITVTAGNTHQNRIQLGNGLIDAEAGLGYILGTEPTAIQGVNARGEARTPATTKRLRGGNIVIERNGRRYNTAGQAMN